MNYCNECGKKVSTGKLRCKPCQLIYNNKLQRERAKQIYVQRVSLKVTLEQYRFLQSKGTMTKYIRKLIRISME